MSPAGSYSTHAMDMFGPTQTVSFKDSDIDDLELSSICASSIGGGDSYLSGNESAVSGMSQSSAPSALRKSKYSSYPYARTDGGRKKKSHCSRRQRRPPHRKNQMNMLPPLEHGSDTDDLTSHSNEKPNHRSIILPPRSDDDGFEVFSPHSPAKKKKKKKEPKTSDQPSTPSTVTSEGGPISNNEEKTGVILMRCSRRSLLFRKWKECVWVYNKPALFLFFRSLEDSIAYRQITTTMNHSPNDGASTIRKRLVKLSVDFDVDGTLKKKMIRKGNGCLTEMPPLPPIRRQGMVKYNTTDLKSKQYKHRGIKETLHYFTLERWTEVGTTTTAKFASSDKSAIKDFRKALKKSLKKTSSSTTKKKKKSKKKKNSHDDDTGYENESSNGSMTSHSMTSSRNHKSYRRGSRSYAGGSDLSSGMSDLSGHYYDPSDDDGSRVSRRSRKGRHRRRRH